MLARAEPAARHWTQMRKRGQMLPFELMLPRWAVADTLVAPGGGDGSAHPGPSDDTAAAPALAILNASNCLQVITEVLAANALPHQLLPGHLELLLMADDDLGAWRSPAGSIARAGVWQAPFDETVTVTARRCLTGGHIELDGRVVASSTGAGADSGNVMLRYDSWDHAFNPTTADFMRVVLDGDLQLDYEPGPRSRIRSAGLRLAYDFGHGPHRLTLRDYAVEKATARSGDAIFAVSGVLTSSAANGGCVVVETGAPLDGLIDWARGELGIRGAAGARILLTAIDATKVRVRLDADGDGSYEIDAEAAWGELSPVL